MKKKILFVDDDTNLLDALRRSLRPMGKTWDLVFVSSGEEALKEMERGPAEIVVSDILMPKMTGADLLRIIKDQYANTLRMILSGETGDEVVGHQALEIAHQCLTKPCNPKHLREAIERAYALKGQFARNTLKDKVRKLHLPPELDDIFREADGEKLWNDPDSQDFLKELAALWTEGSVVSCLDDLRAALGEYLWKAAKAFSAILAMHNPRIFPEFDHKRFRQDALTASHFSALVARAAGLDKESVARYRVAGLFHCIGQLILIVHAPEEYLDVLDAVEDCDACFWDEEKRIFSVEFSQVSAYYASSWNFPHEMIEAFAYITEPTKSTVGKGPSMLAAVHFVLMSTLQGQGISCQLDSTLLEEETLVEWGRLWESRCQ